MDSLSSQMECLLNMQQTVLIRLDSLSRDVRSMGQDLVRMREEDPEGRRGSVAELCQDLCGAVQKASERVDSHGRRLDGVEKLMEGTQQVISLIGEVVKSSRLVELLFKPPGNKSSKKVRFPTGSGQKTTIKPFVQLIVCFLVWCQSQGILREGSSSYSINVSCR